MNKAADLLIHEHFVIQNVINNLDDIQILCERYPEEYEKAVKELLIFFREYADKYHHSKEEIILFPKMSDANDMLGGNIISEMLENHEDFRGYIKNIEYLLSVKKYSEAKQVLSDYSEKLLDHIAVENDELFQMLETLFMDDEIEKIYFSFLDSDRELGDSRKKELEKSVLKIQKLFR